MKRSFLVGVIGLGLTTTSLLLSELHYSYGTSLLKFLLGVGIIYVTLGFGLTRTQGEYARGLWALSILLLYLISTGLVAASLDASLLVLVAGNVDFALGTGAAGAGIIGGHRRRSERSVRDVVGTAVGLVAVSTIVTRLTIPSLTFFPVLQVLFITGILIAGGLPYLLIGRDSSSGSQRG
ncbi:hypothetical protein [Haloplanus halobius]|uniref:hypothetical protein n=1 Tax=Haloplanus halobius TaxID=2934938 RepID=UPI00200EFC1F|nr:hypothetical protein [Haloplanus sp. XH21]